MPKYSRVEESRSLTVKLPSALYDGLRAEASRRRVPPGQIVAELLQGRSGVVLAVEKPPAKPAMFHRAPQPKREGIRTRLSRDPETKAGQIAEGAGLLQRCLSHFDMPTLAGKLGVSDAAVRGWKMEGYIPLDRWEAVQGLLAESNDF